MAQWYPRETDPEVTFEKLQNHLISVGGLAQTMENQTIMKNKHKLKSARCVDKITSHSRWSGKKKEVIRKTLSLC